MRGKITAFVPIKLENERVPNKNISCFFDGKPLIYFILNSLLQVKEENLIDEIYVFCSDKKIKKYIPKNKGIYSLKRPKYLDSQTATTADIIKEFSNIIKSDIYIMAFATSPFLKKNSIIKSINSILYDNYDSSFTIKQLHEFLWDNEKPINYSLSHVPRSQDLPFICIETTGLYVFKKEVFEKYNARIGINPYLCEVSSIESIDINYPDDFEIANAVYKYMVEKGKFNE